MKSNGRSKFDQILAYRYFENVGQPLPSSVVSAKDWRHAIKECASKKWENCRLMARNRLHRLVEERDWNRTQAWNPLADELRPQVIDLAETLIAKVPLPLNLAAKIKHALSWDFMMICFESEYSDIVPPFFSMPLLDHWYAAGHLPCGWDGEEFPDAWDGNLKGGRLLVY